MTKMDDNQMKYIENILQANLNTIREELRGIRSDMNRDRVSFTEKQVAIEIALKEHNLRIETMEKFKDKLLVQISMIVAVGAFLMTFVYEYIKQFIRGLMN